MKCSLGKTLLQLTQHDVTVSALKSLRQLIESRLYISPHHVYSAFVIVYSFIDNVNITTAAVRDGESPALAVTLSHFTFTFQADVVIQSVLAEGAEGRRCVGYIRSRLLPASDVR